MPRFFAPITVPAFRLRCEEAFNEDNRHSDLKYMAVHKILDALAKDIKVSFDTENWEMKEQTWGAKNLLGFQTLDNGMTYLGVQAGGDWEAPVFFCVYWDGKKLRGYVPTEGNPYNTKTMQAFGNDEEADYEDCKKRWPEEMKDVDQNNFDASSWVEFDVDAIRKDMMERIQPKNGQPDLAGDNVALLAAIEELDPSERAQLIALLTETYCTRCGKGRPCPQHGKKGNK
ncbi:MAG: hypothetical protein ACREGR_03485 [Minisyncoccia bacterium]